MSFCSQFVSLYIILITSLSWFCSAHFELLSLKKLSKWFFYSLLRNTHHMSFIMSLYGLFNDSFCVVFVKFSGHWIIKRNKWILQTIIPGQDKTPIRDWVECTCFNNRVGLTLFIIFKLNWIIHSLNIPK